MDDKQLRKERVDAGLCGYCGTRRERFDWHCDSCAAQCNETQNARRARWLAAGLCGMCGEKPSQADAHLCDGCQGKKREAYRRMRARQGKVVTPKPPPMPAPLPFEGLRLAWCADEPDEDVPQELEQEQPDDPDPGPFAA